MTVDVLQSDTPESGFLRKVKPLSMEELVRRKDALTMGLNNSHDCLKNLVISSRRFKTGHYHHVYQCSVCGNQSGGPLSKMKALTFLNGATPSVFDDSIFERYQKKRNGLIGEISQIAKTIFEIQNPLTAAHYAAETSAFEEKKKRTNEVIDKAVSSVRDTYGWQYRFAALQKRIKTHADIFKDPTAKPIQRFHSESELREWLDTWLCQDFEVLREVAGVHITERVAVQIDYVLRPKQHLIDAGFKAGAFGLEVKYLNQEDSFSSKASRFVWQSISYTDCDFQLPEGRVRLSRVLLFSNMSFEGERMLLKGVELNASENEQAKWAALLELANHANVGCLAIIGTREMRYGWKIKFAAGTYFRRDLDAYSIHDAHLFSKVRIGNF